MTNTETPRPQIDEPEAYTNARTEMLEGWEKSDGQPQGQSDVDAKDLVCKAFDAYENERTHKQGIEAAAKLLRPYLTQRPVDLEIVRLAICKFEGKDPNIWSYAGMAKAALDAAQIPYTEKGGR